MADAEILEHRRSGVGVLVKDPDVDASPRHGRVEVLQLRVQHLVLVKVKGQGSRTVVGVKDTWSRDGVVCKEACDSHARLPKQWNYHSPSAEGSLP